MNRLPLVCRPLLVGLAVVFAAVPAPARAQSLFAGQGLGLPGEALDGRAFALGSVALGLPGTTLSLVNPAAVAGIPAPAFGIAFQPAWTQSSYPGGDAETSTSRFPLFHAAAPLGERWAVSAGFGSFLDQRFARQRTDTLTLAGQEFVARDQLTTEGGVGRLRVGGAYAFGERIAVGVALDVFTGSRTGTSSRAFAPLDTAATGTVPVSATRREQWEYGALGVVAGARWNPTGALAFGVSAESGGTLEAEPDSAGSAGAGEYSLPVRLGLGGSARVSSGATVVLGGQWAGWSAADDELSDAGGARDVWNVGGGVEWDPPSEGRAFPLRLGARYAQLPFRRAVEGEAFEFPSERALTGGVGARLAGGAARVDVAAERGWRGGDAAGADESFWRASLSLTLLGR